MSGLVRGAQTIICLVNSYCGSSPNHSTLSTDKHVDQAHAPIVSGAGLARIMSGQGPLARSPIMSSERTRASEPLIGSAEHDFNQASFWYFIISYPGYFSISISKS